MSHQFVFVDIDTQYDFIDPAGSLAVPGVEAIHANLHRLTQYAREHGIPVVATSCAHTPDEEDPEPFPPHCMLGTEGHDRHETTAWVGSKIVPLGQPPAFENIPAHVTLHKRHYDLFTHPHASALFARYAANDPIFVVYGVATDYCVKAAVLGLRERGYRCEVVVDAVRGINPEDEEKALQEFVNHGAVLTITDRVCQN